MKNKVVLITLALLMALFATSSFAQVSGSVKGKVTDQAGQPMVGASVVFQSADTGRKYQLKTDKGGQYFSMGITPGVYNIQVLRDGQLVFQDKVNVKMADANDNTFNFDLKGAAQKGLTEEEKKKQEAAVKANEKIKGLNAKLQQADQATKSGNCELAAQILAETTQADPTRDLLWARLADAQTCAKQYPAAIESYKKAIEIGPNHGEYHNNLGQAYLKANQVDQAIAEYNSAAQVDPTNAGTYYFNLGAVLTNKGKVDDAIVAFDKAIATDPNKADAYYWKGVNMLGKATLDKSGKMVAPPGTAEALNKYLELQPQGPNAQGAKDLLASIGATVQTSFGERKSTPKKK